MLFKKLFVLLLVSLLVSGLTLFAAPGAKKLAVKKGAATVTVKGHIRSWKDVEKISLDQLKKARKLRPVLNFERNRPIVQKSTQQDPVVQTTPGRKSDTEATSGPIMSFAGMNLNSNGAGWPPDTTGDVGETYFVQAVNSSLAIYNKSTGALVSATTFDSFFGGTGISGTPCDSQNNGDPIVLYDQYNERWFVLDFAWDSSENDGSYFSIAASKTSDPTGDWWQYAFRADNTLMDDYPKCGVWHDGIYITANMFSFAGSFQNAKIWALKTPDLYSGTITSQYVEDSSYYAWAILPSSAKGTTPPDSSAPNYMYAMDADEYGSPSTDALYVWQYDVDWNNSSNTTWTGPAAISIASFTITSSGAPQQGTSTTLDSLAGRLMYPAMYRKFATHESVYLSHCADYNSARAMRWYELRISGGVSSVFQQGTYAPDSNHRWMGSVGADKNGSIALGYSISSSSMYPGIAYAGRASTDPAGQLSQGEETLVSGSGYQSSYTRWGDYSTITIDPTDDETFWYTNEYYTSSGTNWQTRIGSFKISTAPDTTPPVISSVAAGSIAMTTATITWTTDESADSEVQYGLTTSYGSTASDSSFVTSHSISLTGLVAETTYHYRVISEDSSGNSTTSSDYSFTTTDTPPVGGIADGIDNANYAYTDGGDAAWDIDETVSNDGSDSAKSGSITHNEDSSFQTSVTFSEAKTVSFYWKVSSESGYDYLKFYLNGVEQDSIAGTVDWTQKSYAVAAGSHVLKWAYEKDYSVSSGSDCGWVDQLVVEGSGSPVTIDFSDNFSDNDASDWSYFGDGTWSAAGGELSGNHASAYVFAVAPAGDLNDGSITVDWTAETDGTWTNGLVIFGWQDADNYCLADCRVGGNKWRLRQCVGGTLSVVATTSETLNASQLYQLEVVIEASGNVTLKADGVSKVTYNFGSLAAGATGVCVHKAHSVFDNFAVAGNPVE
ncbi:MAG: hypothetical protein GY765_03480 [bacterium]|nr:hypothetical protein [bacterium]